MKIRLILLLALLCAGMQQTQAAQKISATTRTQVGRTLTRIVSREVTGGSVRIVGMEATPKRVRIFASIGLSYYPFREQSLAAMVDSVRQLLPKEYRKAQILLYSDKHEVSELIPMANRAESGSKKVKRKNRLVPFVNPSDRPLVVRESSLSAPAHGLAGRHIALWQSHGRYFDQTENQWKWQRSQLWMTAEDLYTQSYVLPYLVPMLENAGAYVILPRERDVQLHEVFATLRSDEHPYGDCTLTDGSSPWHTDRSEPISEQVSAPSKETPFGSLESHTVQTVTGGAESTAAWQADIPEKGDYALYISYGTFPKSTDDAQYTVHRLGGDEQFAVNQTMGGQTWIYLGRFPFDAGKQTVLTLTNRSRQAGRTLSAGLVKIGGGYGSIARSVSDSLRTPGVDYYEETSGYPRYTEGARYWLQTAGFSEKVYSPKQGTDDYKDDYMARAHWVNALMGGSQRMPDSTGLHIPLDMALAFHSDAGIRDSDETIGTLGIFFTRDNKGRFEGGADRYRSRDLTDLVQTQVTSDIRNTFEPEWTRRGLWNRSYYEARVPGVPTMLLELLSHQNFADMRYGTDPRFKFLVSRAVYKGILRYLSSQYEVPYVVQPLPVGKAAVEFSADSSDEVTVSWAPTVDPLEPTAEPTGYIVYTRIDGGGFDNGRYTTDCSLQLAQQPDQIYSYQITALNDGGESFPSEIVSACRLSDAKGCVLVVNGFDRVSSPLSMRSDSLAGFYYDLDSGVPDHSDISFIGPQRVFDRAMTRSEEDSIALGASFNNYETDIIGGNTFDYPFVHGRSIVRAGYSFCSASVHALEGSGLDLTDYAAIDLILGKQRSTSIGRGTSGYEFKTFPAFLQQTLRDYLDGGGALFASGCYVATDLWTGDNNTQRDREFAQEVLHFSFDGDQAADGNRVRVVSHRDFGSGEYRFVTDFRPDRYRIERVDALLPAGNDAFTVMRYADNAHVAAVANVSTGRTLVMGFPFEAIVTEVERDHLMRQALDLLVEKH